MRARTPSRSRLSLAPRLACLGFAAKSNSACRIRRITWKATSPSAAHDPQVRLHSLAQAKPAGFGTGNAMLPDLRFVFGGLITLALMGMVSVGLFVSARLTLQSKVGPLEASRTSVFTDSIEWNQFYDAGSVRRFVGLSPRGEARETEDAPPEHRTEPLSGAPSAIAVAPVDLPTADRLAAPAAATASTVTGVTSPADGPTTIPRPRCPSPPASHRPPSAPQSKAWRGRPTSSQARPKRSSLTRRRSRCPPPRRWPKMVHPPRSLLPKRRRFAPPRSLWRPRMARTRSRGRQHPP